MVLGSSAKYVYLIFLRKFYSGGYGTISESWGEVFYRKVGNMKNGDLRMTSLSAVTIFYVRQTLSNNHLA